MATAVLAGCEMAKHHFDLRIPRAVLRSKFFEQAGLTKPKTPVRDNGYHKGGYQLSVLTQAFCFRLCARSHKRVHLMCHFFFLLYRTDLLRSETLSQNNWWGEKQQRATLVQNKRAMLQKTSNHVNLELVYLGLSVMTGFFAVWHIRVLKL